MDGRQQVANLTDADVQAYVSKDKPVEKKPEPERKRTDDKLATGTSKAKSRASSDDIREAQSRLADMIINDMMDVPDKADVLELYQDQIEIMAADFPEIHAQIMQAAGEGGDDEGKEA